MPPDQLRPPPKFHGERDNFERNATAGYRPLL
jgi:hypothetical protein